MPADLAALDRNAGAAAGGTQRRCPDIAKLGKLGYSPRVPLAKGLPPTVDWYFSQFGAAP